MLQKKKKMKLVLLLVWFTKRPILTYEISSAVGGTKIPSWIYKRKAFASVKGHIHRNHHPLASLRFAKPILVAIRSTSEESASGHPVSPLPLNDEASSCPMNETEMMLPLFRCVAYACLPIHRNKRKRKKKNSRVEESRKTVWDRRTITKRWI